MNLWDWKDQSEKDVLPFLRTATFDILSTLVTAERLNTLDWRRTLKLYEHKAPFDFYQQEEWTFTFPSGNPFLTAKTIAILRPKARDLRLTLTPVFIQPQ